MRVAHDARPGGVAATATAPMLLLWTLLLCRGDGAVAAQTPPDVPDFWPHVVGDLRKVTWAHAVNSRAKLSDALKGDAMMLEADVSISADGETPIMAHPPANHSDLTMEQCMEDIIADGKKGVKLDFKSTDAWKKAVPLLVALRQRMEGFPVWLNADIVAGPGGGSPGVDAARFLADSLTRFPGRTLSVGWTTSFEGKAYTQKHVDDMLMVLSEANVSDAQPITFPVRAASADKSSAALLALLKDKPKATLTLWGSAVDKVDDEDLVELAHAVGFDRLYVDLPKDVPGLTGGAGAGLLRARRASHAGLLCAAALAAGLAFWATQAFY